MNIPKSEGEACQRILLLEAELEKSNKAVTESVHELSKEKQSCLDLENRVGELEMALRLERKKVHSNGVKLDLDTDSAAAVEYGKMLEMTKKKRDDALELVREIRKLML
jgi:histidinol phosphatase-like PHP family hydrolase